MTRFNKDTSGNYNIHGKKFKSIEGTRAQVYHGNAYETSGGLKKSDLIMNKNGRIVSKKKQITAKKDKRLLKYGYSFKKGKFGCVKLDGTKCSRKSKKHRGGRNYLQENPYPQSVGMMSSTAENAPNGYTRGGMGPLNPSSFPDSIGMMDDKQGLGSISHQSMLAYPNNTPMDVALLAGGRRKTKRRRY